MDYAYSTTMEAVRKSGKHFTLDERGQIQALHREGFSLRAIAARVGCSHTAIHYELKRGTPERQAARGRSPQYTAQRGEGIPYKTPAHEEVNLRGRAFSAAPAEAGASPYLGSSDAQSLPRSSPIGGCERIYSFARAKRLLDFGCVRADGELTRHMSAAGWYTVLFASAPCVRGCRSVFSRLRCALRSATAVSPACPAFVRAVTLSAGVR